MWNFFKSLFRRKRIKPHIHKDQYANIWDIYYTREMKTLYMYCHDPVKARYWAKQCWELPEYLKTGK